MGTPVLVRHDRGCLHAREAAGGHSDAAKRLSDTYNLHMTCGARLGSFIAVNLSDARGDGVVYDTRAAAVDHQRHDEGWKAFIKLGAPHMSVCEAASVLRWQRQANELASGQRGEKSGGLEVIPRLTIEGRERQIAAMSGRINMPLALGRSDPR
jgi:hypothetical protein